MFNTTISQNNDKSKEVVKVEIVPVLSNNNKHTNRNVTNVEEHKNRSIVLGLVERTSLLSQNCVYKNR